MSRYAWDIQQAAVSRAAETRRSWLTSSASGPGAAALAALRKRYTMQAERDIHDRVAGTDAPDDALAPVVKRQSVQAVDGDDLCDVLF